MALGDTRRRMRIMSLTTAASMINDYFSGGADNEEIGLTEEEAEIMEQENKKVAAKLYAMAEKLDKQGE
ncbi:MULTISPECIES: hypothetical protein [Vibrio]|uniref:hypothetical protein n=1 Tax=Vibrio TaxID=662 RepID=UPI000EFC4965|nr:MULTISPECIES: hypothetical protein [Vibrio]MCC4838002.1 hypothetical protein [Vibrio lentus]